MEKKMSRKNNLIFLRVRGSQCLCCSILISDDISITAVLIKKKKKSREKVYQPMLFHNMS